MVRVMKARKVLGYSELIQEVIVLMASRFKPPVQLIKRCIEELIDKEYLRRSENSKRIIEYIS